MTVLTARMLQGLQSVQEMEMRPALQVTNVTKISCIVYIKIFSAFHSCLFLSISLMKFYFQDTKCWDGSLATPAAIATVKCCYGKCSLEAADGTKDGFCPAASAP